MEEGQEEERGCQGEISGGAKGDWCDSALVLVQKK